LVERAHTIDALRSKTGFSAVVHRGKTDKETFMENWRTRIAGEPKFRSQRLNEIFNLTKSHTIGTDMTTWQILWWANAILNPFGLVLRSMRDKHFRLEEKIDMKALIERKNKIGKFYIHKGRTAEAKETANIPLLGRSCRKSSDKQEMFDNTYDTSLLDRTTPND
jgi:hypothetical protein